MNVAVLMVKDEADIIGFTIRHLFGEGIDRILVADNGSTDETRDILDHWASTLPVTVVDDWEPGYYQADKMTALAHQAISLGAEWVLPCDADELWYANEGTIAETLAGTDADVIRAQGWDHIVTPCDPPGRNPYRTAIHRRTYPQKLPKVAFRATPTFRLHMGNHDVDHPGRPVDGLLALRHFQYRSREQMARKVRQGKAAYEASNLHYDYGTHWRIMGGLSDADLDLHWQDLLDEPGLIPDPAPYRG
jgi:hypothetical protein